MEDVNFSYVRENRVITESAFKAAPGEIVALVGPSGEGKTTVLRLILGLVRPEEGKTVLVASDGRETLMNAETRHLFAYVPQGNTLLSGTIAENMRMGKEQATDEEIIEALKIACAWEFVEKLPNTINSSVGERGKGFSEGQAQRLSIARAVLKSAGILIFDDATSALDLKTEADLYRALNAARPETTKIIVAQRIASVRRADRIVVLRDGGIDACGTHEELLRSCKTYQDIYHSQIGEEGLDNG